MLSVNKSPSATIITFSSQYESYYDSLILGRAKERHPLA